MQIYLIFKSDIFVAPYFIGGKTFLPQSFSYHKQEQIELKQNCSCDHVTSPEGPSQLENVFKKQLYQLQNIKPIPGFKVSEVN